MDMITLVIRIWILDFKIHFGFIWPPSIITRSRNWSLHLTNGQITWFSHNLGHRQKNESQFAKQTCLFAFDIIRSWNFECLNPIFKQSPAYLSLRGLTGDVLDVSSETLGVIQPDLQANKIGIKIMKQSDTVWRSQTDSKDYSGCFLLRISNMSASSDSDSQRDRQMTCTQLMSLFM